MEPVLSFLRAPQLSLIKQWRISKFTLFSFALSLTLIIMASYIFLRGEGEQKELLTSVSKTTVAKFQVSSENHSTAMESLVKLLSSKLEYAPRKVPKDEDIFEMDPELFSAVPRQFLPNITSPCWYEELFDTVNPQQRIKYQEEGDKLFRLRCLPYVYIIGQQKCGTTDLYNRLRVLPEANFNRLKEPNYWRRRAIGADYYKRFMKSTFSHVGDYLDLYEKAASKIQEGISGYKSGDYNALKIITVDGSTSNLWDHRGLYLQRGWKDTEPPVLIADLIHKVQPGAKIIVILRDPVERLYSAYLFSNEPGKTRERFHLSVVRMIQLFQSCLSKRSLRFCAYNPDLLNKSVVKIQLGMYFVFLRDWLTVFPREQILILRFEDYKAHLKEEIMKVFDFLNVDPLTQEVEKMVVTKHPSNTQEDQYQKLGPMLPSTRDLLREFYQPFNKKLASFLENEGFLWNKN